MMMGSYFLSSLDTICGVAPLALKELEHLLENLPE
jgi:hypothetical protein